MMAPYGVILMGGQSRRMGGVDKALLHLGDRTLLDHVIGRLAPQTGDLALSANGDPARLAQTGLPVLPDDNLQDSSLHDQGLHGAGPLAGVLAGLGWAARQGADHIVTVPADVPFVPCDLVPRLLLAAGDGDFAIAASPRGPQPLCALWPVRLVPAVRQALAAGQRRVMDLVRAQGAAIAAFPDDAAFHNINTAADLATARALMGQTTA